MPRRRWVPRLARKLRTWIGAISFMRMRANSSTRFAEGVFVASSGVRFHDVAGHTHHCPQTPTAHPYALRVNRHTHQPPRPARGGVPLFPEPRPLAQSGNARLPAPLQREIEARRPHVDRDCDHETCRHRVRKRSIGGRRARLSLSTLDLVVEAVWPGGCRSPRGVRARMRRRARW